MLYNNGSDYFASSVIFISLDGFKPDYLKLGITPNLDKIVDQGIHADYMYPSFPSLTFPNHWTLVTGQYPESHGIVANEFYDPKKQQTFTHGNLNCTTDPEWWDMAEPIWVTGSKNGRRSASIMWPGSAAVESEYIVSYNGSVSPLEEIKLVLELIDKPYDERPHLISTYMHHVDTDGHVLSPEGPGITLSIKLVDKAIGYLMDELKKRNLDEHMHIVVVSDHGMATTKNYIFYDDILSNTSLSYLNHREAWPLLDLRPHADAPSNATQQIYEELVNYRKDHPNEAHYQVYLKDEVPEKYHYSNNDRITPIVTIPDVGYTFISHDNTDKTSGKFYQPLGMHGFDPFEQDMLAIFMAKGPKINKWYSIDPSRNNKTKVEPFQNVEIYELLTEIININGNPNNGTLHGKFNLANSINNEL
ncbi:alkaline-phosphatase-like protein [Cunninghamella echinulata]|nr:alkaline-phosphatase-like protein [Cunninghamella echinulata]